MMRPKVVYGIILIENKKASISIFEGDRYPKPKETIISDDEGKGNPHFSIVKKAKSAYSGKTRKGGQSEDRIEGRRRETSKGFLKRVADATKTIFMPHGKLSPTFKGLLIGGPGETKNHFTYDDYLHPYLRNQVIAVENVGYDDEAGIRELITKAQDKLRETRLIVEEKLMKEFLGCLIDNKPVTYGKDEIQRALDERAVKTLLLSSRLESEEIDDYLRRVEEMGVNVEVLSYTSEAGYQLWESFKGRAAMLKDHMNIAENIDQN